MGHLYSKISQNLQQGPMPHPALTWVKFGVAKWIELTFCRPLHATLWAQCVTPPQLFKRPFLQDHPGEPVPEENFWALWCKGRLTEADTDHPAGRHSIRTSQCPPPPSPHFLQAGCPSCHPPNTVKALKATSVAPSYRNTDVCQHCW